MARIRALIEGLKTKGIEGSGRLHISVLARVWLQKLAQMGLREVDPSSGSPPKWSYSLDTRTKTPYEDARPAKLDDSRQVFWLKLDGPWTKEGYRSVEVLDSHLKTDTAIVAALTNLEAGPVDVERFEKALSSVEAPLRESIIRDVLDLATDAGPSQTGPSEGEPKSEEDIPWAEPWAETLMATMTPPYERFFEDLQKQSLSYMVALLRHYRPEFDELLLEEQLALLKDCCRRVNALLTASQQLSAFLEYGVPSKDLRSKMVKVQRDVRAAELKDVEGHSGRKIGEILGLEPTKSDLLRRQNSRVRDSIKRGRRLLTSAWGEEGWRKQAIAKGNKRRWWRSLSKEEQNIALYAESEGLSMEEARRLFKEGKVFIVDVE